MMVICPVHAESSVSENGCTAADHALHSAVQAVFRPVLLTVPLVISGALTSAVTVPSGISKTALRTCSSVVP